MNNSSQRLVDYSSDEEFSTEETNFDPTVKVPDSKQSIKSENENTQNSLPLPQEIQEMYKDNGTDMIVDDPALHGGKVRSFPHERGVWATHVFIPFEPSSEFFEMAETLFSTCRNHGIDLEVVESFHVSLSKCVKLRHHWIQPFVESLRIHLSTFYRFKLMFQSLEVYENEERTRTFLGLKVHIGYDHLQKLTKKVDQCLKDFQLPTFYENPSFHLSFASCVGSKLESIESVMADLDIQFQSFVEYNPSFRTLWVTDINCKSGNKLFTFNLKT